eukprot:TRINITY_DN846_c0_g2_i1.p1 TRINITY_DN846_c0_g2~~TRINITY_DN846_c0_g2_i1.p1  ORF type:complete len:532 (-),score=114.59 TRINITY_DN846_c0_g2_i1:314-1696(-)
MGAMAPLLPTLVQSAGSVQTWRPDLSASARPSGGGAPILIETPPSQTVASGSEFDPPLSVFVAVQNSNVSYFVRVSLLRLQADQSTGRVAMEPYPDGVVGEVSRPVNGQRATFNRLRLNHLAPGQAMLRFTLCHHDGSPPPHIDNPNIFSAPFNIVPPGSMPSLPQMSMFSQAVPSSLAFNSPAAAVGQVYAQLGNKMQPQTSAWPTVMMDSKTAWQLQYTGDIGDHVFKDSPLSLHVRAMPIVPTPSTQSLRFPSRVRFTVSLEDAHNQAVDKIVKGRRAGARILAQEEYDVPLSVENEAELPNVRIREVSRNHSGGAFRLCVHMTDFPFVGAARSRLFHVRSERIRAPSYNQQVTRQRERRQQRNKSGPNQDGAQPPTGEPDDANDDDEDEVEKGSRSKIPLALANATAPLATLTAAADRVSSAHGAPDQALAAATTLANIQGVPAILPTGNEAGDAE